jgi:hypothetical protein
MSLVDRLLAAIDHQLDDAAVRTLAALRLRAKREAGCRRCRGYGWHVKSGLPATGKSHADQVMLCGCPAGGRFWTLALDELGGVLALMDLDSSGRIASVDGMYGRFGINDRRLLRLAAAGPRPESCEFTRGAFA